MDKEYLLKKWLQNELSDEELKAFNALDDAELYKEIIEEAKRFSGDANVPVHSFKTLSDELESKKKNSLPWTKFVWRAAAVVLVLFGFYTLFNQNKIALQHHTDYAQKETITLPDNSTVNLNELSTLTYDPANWDANRLLTLEGEAYFDVEKGNRFDVTTSSGKVSVLGTEFNVLSRDSIFKVSCYEGLVQVTYKNNAIKLQAGTEFTLLSGNAKKSVIAIAEPHWLKNMSVFENASLSDVIKEFKKQYKVEIDYPLDLHLKFTGAFEHNNLENALKSITQPLNLTYTVENKNKVIIRNVQD